ncbi:MAG: hypothetical protein JXB38_21570 [Anaerolineales bacterium]|nr:hypothetical protein [Anaerolineales bacterium]
MNDEQRYDCMIDTAIESYPFAALPKGFVTRTLQQAAQLKFRLSFVDIAIPLFFSAFGMLAFFLTFWLWTYLDPLWFADLQLRLTLALLYISIEPLSFAIGLGVVMGVVVFMGIALVYLFIYRPYASPKLKI